MAAILLVPGNNPVLHYIAHQLEQREDVLVLGTANDALWQTRRVPPRLVIADSRLEDMRGVELAEILPDLAPAARVVICGPDDPGSAAQARAVGAEWLALPSHAAQAIRAVFEVLGLPPPANLPGTTELQAAPRARPATLDRQAAEAGAAPSAAPASDAAATSARPVPKPAPPEPTTFGRSAALVVQPQQHQHLAQLLEWLASTIEAPCVLLVDQAGMVLAQSGSLPGVVVELVAPLLATTFSATGQLARQLQEQRANAAYVHEGEHYDLYAFNIDYRVSLIVIFDKRVQASTLGTVWIYARRTMQQIRRILQS